MVESIVKIKSFDLAVSGVNFYKYIVAEKKEYIMSKQFLRCITSVGANVREAVNAQSKLDFIHKLSIAQKEINETIYWLEHLVATNYIDKNVFESINTDAIEIIKLTTSSIKTAKQSLTTNH